MRLLDKLGEVDKILQVRVVEKGPHEDVGGWPSGQRQQTVNLPTDVYGGSNPPPPTT